MDDLGFEALTDDQLVELARALAAEMVRRSPDVIDAASVAIKQAVAQRAASMDAVWAQKKWIARLVTDALGEGWRISIWNSPTGEQRAYLENNVRRVEKWTLYVTGNRNNPPGSLHCHYRGARQESDRHLVQIICTTAVATYPGGIAITCDQAAATPYHTPPAPQEWTDRMAELAETGAR